MNADFLTYNDCAIYSIQNINSGKVYIGQSVEYSTRIKAHIRTFKNETHCNKYLQRTFNKNSDLLHATILEITTKEQLNEKEIFWIKFFNSTNPEKGYNLAEGGNVIFHNHTEERKKNMSTWMQEKWKTGFFKPIKHTEETKEKMSKTRLEKYKHGKPGESVKVLSLLDGSIIGEYSSIKEVSKKLAINVATIYLKLNGKIEADFPKKGFKIVRSSNIIPSKKFNDLTKLTQSINKKELYSSKQFALSKKVRLHYITTGVIKEFNTMKEASKFLGFNPFYLHQRFKNKKAEITINKLGIKVILV